MADSQGAKQTAYKLGEGFATRADGSPLVGWPYQVYYSPGHPRGDLYMAEGDARNGNGNFFPAARILEPLWRDHLTAAGVLWLLPLLERMARGEAVTADEVLAAYRREHGAEPPTESWAV